MFELRLDAAHALRHLQRLGERMRRPRIRPQPRTSIRELGPRQDSEAGDYPGHRLRSWSMFVNPEAITQPDPLLTAALAHVELEGSVSKQRLFDRGKIRKGRRH